MFYCAVGVKGMQIMTILPLSMHAAYGFSEGPGSSMEPRCRVNSENKSKNSENAPPHRQIAGLCIFQQTLKKKCICKETPQGISLMLTLLSSVKVPVQ